MDKIYHVIWAREAKNSLKNICSSARANSDSHADKLKNAVFQLAFSLDKHPNRFPKIKLNTPNLNVRFAIVFNLKIYFQVDDNKLNVTIVDILYAKAK